MYVILVYDVSQDENGKKVLPKVHKVCKKYLSHIQNSEFEGEITESKIMELHKMLTPIIRKDIDSVILFQSRNKRWLEKDFWGMDNDKTNNFI